MMLLLLAGGYALFGVLFRYEGPRVNPTEHKGGRISLYPVQPNSPGQQWLEVHDPARIARGSEIPEPAPRPDPGNAPKPEPVIPLQAPQATAPQAVRAGEIPAELPPVIRPDAGSLRFEAMAPETYPRVWINREKHAAPLPEPLLKQAASVNAGTVELRFSRGIVPGEIRASVVRSSGSTRLDQALITYFAAHSFREFPAHVKTVWDAAGEVEK